MDIRELAIEHCKSFSDQTEQYLNHEDLGRSNSIYYQESYKGVDIQLNSKSQNNKIFIMHNFIGRLRVVIKGSNNIIFIGNNCTYRGKNVLNVRNDSCFVSIGDDCTSSGNTALNVALNDDPENCNLIIGDDAMFAKNISIFTSDNHPVFDVQSFEKINNSKTSLVIEPHVWLGAGVLVTKSVKIGAGTNIGMGSIVTKDIDSFSVYAGVPAKKLKANTLWCRNSRPPTMEATKKWYESYKNKIEHLSN